MMRTRTLRPRDDLGSLRQRSPLVPITKQTIGGSRFGRQTRLQWIRPTILVLDLDGSVLVCPKFLRWIRSCNAPESNALGPFSFGLWSTPPPSPTCSYIVDGHKDKRPHTMLMYTIHIIVVGILVVPPRRTNLGRLTNPKEVRAFLTAIGDPERCWPHA